MMTIRLRKPRKLGDSVVSWLRQDGFDWEWMASTWRYFLRKLLLMASVASAASFSCWAKEAGPPRLATPLEAVAGLRLVPVVVAVLMVE